MNIKQRLLAGAVLALALLFFFCVSTYAYEPVLTASGSCGTSATWEFYAETGELRILGSGAMKDYDSSRPWESYKDQISTLSVGNGITSIGKRAFSECLALTDVSISNSVASIGESAFMSCTLLETIDIPESVKSLGSSSFIWCSKLTSITFHEGLESIGSAAFQLDGLTSISIPSSVSSIGDRAFLGCKDLTQFAVSENNNAYSSKNGVLFNKDCTSLIQYPSANEASSYTLPDSVLVIESSAFQFADNLVSIHLPYGVTTLGDVAFGYCSKLESVNIPNSVESVGSSIFASSAIKTCVLSSGMTEIPTSFFYQCRSLTSITIPHSVVTIKSYCIKSCDSLTTVIYEGTEDDWSNNVTVEPSNDSLTSSILRFHTKHSRGTATCYKRATCEECGLEYGSFAHQMQEIEAVNPTCTESGHSAYHYCSLCQRCFSNPEGYPTDEITQVSTIINPIDHNIVDGQCHNCGLVDDSISKNFAGGDGTPNNPLLIETKEQLNLVRNYLFSNYRLKNNVAFTKDDSSWVPIALERDNPFYGSFDGNGHHIVGLSSDRNGFGFIRFNSGTIENLTLSDANIELEYYSGATNPGAIIYGERFYGNGAGLVYSNSGMVSNCCFEGSISAGNGRVGGVVCYNTASGIVMECSNFGTVHPSYNPKGEICCGGIVADNCGIVTDCRNYSKISCGNNDVGYSSYVGGICGISTGRITKSANYGDISSSCATNNSSGAPAHSGGIVGKSTGTITDCYNCGEIISTNYGGGIAGYDNSVSCCYSTQRIGNNGYSFDPYYIGLIVGYGNATDCFFPSSLTNVCGGKGVGNAETDPCTMIDVAKFTDSSQYSNFDFENVWGMGENAPELKDFFTIKGQLSISGLNSPVKGVAPDETATLSMHLSADSVLWFVDSTNEAVSGNFAAFTVYRAEIRFSVSSGYNLSDNVWLSVPTGATSAIIDAENGVIKVVYAPTARNILKGSCSVTGKPYVGFKLTVEVESNNTGNLSYQWKRDGVNIEGATEAEYIVTEDDIGTSITCSVESDIEAGSLTSSNGITITADSVQACVEATRQESCISFRIQKADSTSGTITVMVCQYDSNDRMVAVYYQEIEFGGNDIFEGNTGEKFAHASGCKYKLFVVQGTSLASIADATAIV